jgi:hypothetical protein
MTSNLPSKYNNDKNNRKISDKVFNNFSPALSLTSLKNKKLRRNRKIIHQFSLISVAGNINFRVSSTEKIIDSIKLYTVL